MVGRMLWRPPEAVRDPSWRPELGVGRNQSNSLRLLNPHHLQAGLTPFFIQEMLGASASQKKAVEQEAGRGETKSK